MITALKTFVYIVFIAIGTCFSTIWDAFKDLFIKR